MSEIMPDKPKWLKFTPYTRAYTTKELKPEFMKNCFCVGPENCNDENCPLVKRYKERNNG